MAKAIMHFPSDFKWGTATSAHQVEGYNINNDWWQWEQSAANIANGDHSGLACNWWQDAERDLNHAARLGTTSHRLSIEWSRIEPLPGVFDKEALERYRQIIEYMLQLNIEPMVTLHHFTNPIWLVEKGDFDTDLVVDYFERYVSHVVDGLGDLVTKWITINEPMVYFLMRYLTDSFPAPIQRGWKAGFRVVRNMLACHAKAYQRIKSIASSAEVGVAKHYRPIEALSQRNLLDRWWARRVSHFFNDLWLDSMTTGRLDWPIGQGSITDLEDSYDFIGINYYSKAVVRFPPTPNRLYETNPSTGAIMVDDDFFEHYPAGLFQAIEACLVYNKPIYITEHGIPDRDDKLRPASILTHLREIWRAINFNYPIMGYYHWSLIDNFEWERGWSQRFGLIEIDQATQSRNWRPSAYLYQEICNMNAISSDMASRFAPGIVSLMFPG